MNTLRRRLVFPAFLIILGLTWLLNVVRIKPEVDWVWTAGLAAVGLLFLLGWGLNKVTLVGGFFLIAAAVCSFLRQTGQLGIEVEVPVLLIVFGCLLALAQLSSLPLPRILADADGDGEDKQ